jgi:putative ABC transport system permease protein
MTFFTELREGLAISWGAIRANKLRSVLTTLGIVIGIVTVTLMGTAIEGLNAAFLRSVSSLGADVFYVERFSWFNASYEDWLRSQNRREISLAHVKALARELTLAQAVAPVADWRAPVRYRKRRSDRVFIIGTTEQFLITSGFAIAQGRFLSDAEAEGGRPVCVLGWQVATNLFERESAVGNRVRIGPDSFEVVGVVEKQGSFLGQFSLDNQVFIPLPQYLTSFYPTPDYSIHVKASSLARLEDAKEELRGVLRRIRHVEPGAADDFAINQQEQFISTFHRVAGTIAAVGVFITGLSLFVGGIGIMNIMFVSVAERTREIGVRKAIGAKRRSILVQFLSEAASICLIGGLIGLTIAWALTFVIREHLPMSLSVPIATLAIIVSLMTGLVSGFLPAWRAARMNPVDALRNE